MTTEPIPNPTAFPRVESIVDPNRTWGNAPYKFPVTSTDGMTLRDHFAGKAMAAAIENTPRLGAAVDEAALFQAISAVSYRMADAMLAERIKPIAEPAPAAAPTYTDEQRAFAARALAAGEPVALPPGKWEALVDAVAEALGMRRAGA